MTKVRASIQRMAKTSLGDSVPAELTERIAREIMTGYDMRLRTGFRDSIPISGQIAASAVVDDAIACGKFLMLVERMAELDRDGFMGRTFPIPSLRDLVQAITAEGFLWDDSTRHFMENPAMKCTPNWGRLYEGEEYRFSLLRLDIVKNSKLVRKHGEEAARRMYGELRDRFSRAVEKRYGRVWRWEGDGGLAAFHYGRETASAALAGIDFLHELFMFNRTRNGVGEPVSVRLAAHSGTLTYSDSESEISKQETTKETIELESKKTPPNSLCASKVLTQHLDRCILDHFSLEVVDGTPLHLYRVEVENA